MPSPAFWRLWHRWLGLPAALFLLWAAATGVLVAGTEFFGEDEARREALRDAVSPLTAADPIARAITVNVAAERALAAVAARAGDAPVDRLTFELKGPEPRVLVFTGKRGGGEDRKFVVDARTGRIAAEEAYADKPFLYRLHSGEAFGDGGLVGAMGWGIALLWLTVSGLWIYWRMRPRGAAPAGWRRVFW